MSEPEQKQQVQTSFFNTADAQESPPAPVNIQFIPDIPDDFAEPAPDVGAVPFEPVFVNDTAVVVEPDGPLFVDNAINVYAGSLTGWFFVMVFSVIFSTQGVKRLFRWPLHEREPPFRLGGKQVGGWTEKGFGWFVRVTTVLVSIPAAIVFLPRFLDALGYGGEFAWWQLAGGGLPVAVISSGVWGWLPENLKKWLNGDDQQSGLATDSDVANVRADVEALKSLIEQVAPRVPGMDTDTRGALYTALAEVSGSDLDADAAMDEIMGAPRKPYPPIEGEE